VFLLTSPQAPPAMQRICSKQRLDELRTSSRDSLPYPVENEPPLVQKCRAPGYSGGELNLQPSLWFMAAICCFSASATAFLEAYVLSASGHLAVFLVGGYVVFSSYFVCDYVMMRVSTSYAAIPDAKKFYVLSNLVKAAVLLSYTPVAARTLYLGMVNDEWRTTSIRNLGVLYAIPDTVSLLLVERMALTTRIHHLCVIVFMVINLFNDYSERNVWRALVVYAVFSTFAYLVNLLLASRFLAVHPSLSYWLSAGALVIYTSCLAANWAWQVHYLTGLWVDTRAYSILAYVGVILLVVWDDVVLVKWLVGNLRGGGTKSASAQQQQRASGAAPVGKEKPV